jgi:hypothetical protein
MVNRTGLNERLDQHTQHSGMLVGISMAVVVALLIGTFVWIFFRLDPFFTDFAGRTGVDRGSPVAARNIATPQSSARPGSATPADNPFPQLPTPTALGGATPRITGTPSFLPTHTIADFGQPVNLRAGPNAGSARVALLTPGTKLQFLNEDDRSSETVWLRFQTERGDVGWVRQLDTVVIANPGTAPATPTGSPRPR